MGADNLEWHWHCNTNFPWGANGAFTAEPSSFLPPLLCVYYFLFVFLFPSSLLHLSSTSAFSPLPSSPSSTRYLSRSRKAGRLAFSLCLLLVSRLLIRFVWNTKGAENWAQPHFHLISNSLASKSMSISPANFLSFLSSSRIFFSSLLLYLLQFSNWHTRVLILRNTESFILLSIVSTKIHVSKMSGWRSGEAAGAWDSGAYKPWSPGAARSTRRTRVSSTFFCAPNKTLHSF